MITTKKEKTTKPENNYLMWVGAQHYPTIKSYVDEALEMGVSKRLPNVAVAEKMLDPNTVVFVAHDEGEYHECPACVGTIECPECRKRNERITRLRIEREDFVEDGAVLENEIEWLETELDFAEERGLDADKSKERIKEWKTAMKRCATKAEKRSVKIAGLIDELNGCVDCGGMGKMKGGTGGKVVFGNGVAWEYRKYNYWLHLPKKWTPAEEGDIVAEEMCANCGGTGRLPNGRIFGLFIPGATEYILKPEDEAALKAEIEEKGIATVEKVIVEAEPKRGCGVRKAGGYYAVTKPSKEKTKATMEAVKKLVESGAVEYEEVKVTGNFVEFLAPVEIDSKRFRGIKRWSLDPEAEEEAEMVLDGLED